MTKSSKVGEKRHKIVNLDDKMSEVKKVTNLWKKSDKESQIGEKKWQTSVKESQIGEKKWQTSVKKTQNNFKKSQKCKFK